MLLYAHGDGLGKWSQWLKRDGLGFQLVRMMTWFKSARSAVLEMSSWSTATNVFRVMEVMPGWLWDNRGTEGPKTECVLIQVDMKRWKIGMRVGVKRMVTDRRRIMWKEDRKMSRPSVPSRYSGGPAAEGNSVSSPWYRGQRTRRTAHSQLLREYFSGFTFS